MGADLWIRSINDKVKEKYQTKFEKAVEKRNKLEKDTPEFHQAQTEVEVAYEKLMGEGYFRDSYNNSSVMWKLGLSWWKNVTPMLDKEGKLQPPKIEVLLGEVRSRSDMLKESIADLSKKDQAWYKYHYAELITFLETALELKEPIDAWL